MENGDVKKMESFLKAVGATGGTERKVLCFYNQVTDKHGAHKDADKPRVFVADPAETTANSFFV